MAVIHPTALVDEDVELADDVYIGPNCVLRNKVKIGPGGVLHGSAYLHGPLVIGAKVRIYPFCCIGFAPQHRGYDPAMDGAGIVIGDGNVFRENVTVNRATGEHPTRIGHENFFMGATHIGHDAAIADRCTFAQGAVIGGHATVADGVTIGGIAGLHQFVRIGRLAMIAGGIGVTQDVTPFCILHHTNRILGLNLVGLRRAGYRKHIDPLKRAFDLFYRGRLSNQSAARRISEELGDDPLCAEFARFIEQTRRGFCRLTGEDDGTPRHR